jgi:hypothetical protein
MARRYKYREQPRMGVNKKSVIDKKDKKADRTITTLSQQQSGAKRFTKKKGKSKQLKDHDQALEQRTKPSPSDEHGDVKRKRSLIKKELLKVERFDKAFFMSLLLIAALSFLIFIPIIGPYLALTFVPYFACSRGCRYVSKRNGIQVGLLVAILWSIIEVLILFQFLSYVGLSLAEPGIHTSIDVAILIAIFTSNMLFCAIGGFSGGTLYEKLKENELVLSK